MTRISVGCAWAILLLPLLHFSTPQSHSPGKRSSPHQLHSYDSLRTDFSDYVYPTDAGKILTSVFAEYRRTHFHGGIDISTRDDIGYRVFTARDGYVSRIHVSPTGYGKSIWVKHPDGYSTTYNHLSKFNDGVEALVRHEQLRLERYPVTIEPKPGDFPVKKGEVIAYTGETGTGSPHLHFEIRDENGNFVNPLLCKLIAFEDDSLPRIRRIAITPLLQNSFVDGSDRSRTIEIQNPVRSSIVLNETVYVSGTFGFAVDARDKINGSRFNSGVYSHKLYLDDSLLYGVKLDRAPAKDDYQVGLHYDFTLMSEEEGRYEKLYMNSPNRLPFYHPRTLDAGVINTAMFRGGLHRFRIISNDFKGNSTEVSGTIGFSRNSAGAPAFPRSFVRRTTPLPIASAELLHETQSEFVRIVLKTDGAFTAEPVIVLQEGILTSNLTPLQTDYNTYTATFRPSDLQSGRRIVIATCEVNGRAQTARDEFDIYPVGFPGSTISVDDGAMVIVVDTASFFKPTYLEPKKIYPDNGSVVHYSLLPRFTVLNRGITVKLRALPYHSRQALYYRNQSRGDWLLASRKRDGDYVVDKLERWLGDVSLQIDTEPPTVSRLVTPQRFKQQPHHISFRMRDNLSGVEYKEAKLYIDDVFVVPEIDGEHKRIINRLPQPLKRGMHSVRILLKDRIGNPTEIRKTFRVR